jgi:adenylate kinase
LIVLLFGPPGCGKGTQAGWIASRFSIPAISTGEVFRAEVKAGTELGRQASAIMAAGGLVPDQIVDAVVAHRIVQPDCVRGFLLDGYPRTIPQAEHLAGVLEAMHLPAPMVVHLDVPDAALVARLTARRQCPACKRIYNLLSQPPRVAEQCDDDGAALISREDDKEEVIRRRLAAYQEQTGPLLKWYGAGRTLVIDGSLPPAEVSRAIEAALRSL